MPNSFFFREEIQAVDIFIIFLYLMNRSENQAENFPVIKIGREKENSQQKNPTAGTAGSKACGAGSVGGMERNLQSTRHPAVKQEAPQFIEE